MQIDLNNNLGANQAYANVPAQSAVYLQIEPYMGQAGVVYTFSVSYTSASYSYQQSVQIGYQRSDLVARLYGGNRLQGVGQLLNLTAVVFDPDRSKRGIRIANVKL